jgi:hypothetical protein
MWMLGLMALVRSDISEERIAYMIMAGERRGAKGSEGERRGAKRSEEE